LQLDVSGVLIGWRHVFHRSQKGKKRRSVQPFWLLSFFPFMKRAIRMVMESASRKA
jgi:hypothetical protein